VLGTVTIVDGTITAIQILNSGRGYITPPSITITSDSGSGASAICTLITSESVLPVDSEGNLLSPFISVVGNYDSSQYEKSWVFGDEGPVEYSWRASSAYPFAVMRLLALTRPAQFFSLFADRDLYKFDLDYNQYLLNQRYRLDANGVQIYGNGVSKASFINFIVDYNQQLGRDSTTKLETDLANLDVRLCYRTGAFTDKQYTEIYTERSSPNSINSSLLLPPESYNLLLYKNLFRTEEDRYENIHHKLPCWQPRHCF
jgi:hypothetical protein